MSARRRFGVPGLVVAHQCPQHVGTAAGQAGDPLDRSFTLGSFPVVVGPGFGVAAQAGLRGHVHHPAQSVVVAAWGVQPAGTFAGVAGDRGQTGVRGEAVGGLDEVKAADRSEQLSSKPGNRSRAWRRSRRPADRSQLGGSPSGVGSGPAEPPSPAGWRCPRHVPAGEPLDNPAGRSLGQRHVRRSQSAARNVQAGRAASSFTSHPKADQHHVSRT